MEHTTRIELENLKDLYAVELGILNTEDVRRLTKVLIRTHIFTGRR